MSVNLTSQNSAISQANLGKTDTLRSKELAAVGKTMTDEKPLDSGLIYAPRYWPHSEPWAPKDGKCRAAVHDGGRWAGFHQCTRNAKVERDVLHRGKLARFAYCRTHDPEAVKAKAAAWREKYEADRAAERMAHEQRAREVMLRDAALDAIRQIAAGHNDARGLAQDVLAQWDGHPKGGDGTAPSRSDDSPIGEADAPPPPLERM